MSNIYVVVEHFKGEVQDISFEMLGKAKELGDVTAVLIGNKELASQLGAAGKVICHRQKWHVGVDPGAGS